MISACGEDDSDGVLKGDVCGADSRLLKGLPIVIGACVLASIVLGCCCWCCAARLNMVSLKDPVGEPRKPTLARRCRCSRESDVGVALDGLGANEEENRCTARCDASYW